MNSHDWVRVLETLAQGAGAAILTYLAGAIPAMDLGSYKPLGMLAVLVISEIVKRYLQSPTVVVPDVVPVVPPTL